MLERTYFIWKLIACLVLALTSTVSQAANPTKGGEKYASHCAGCHGATGVSIMPDAPNFAQNESLMQPDTQLLVSIRQGKNAMPAFQGILSDHDIMDVIAFLRTLN